MNNDELNNQNQDDFIIQDPSTPTYSARGTQNLNQAPVAPTQQAPVTPVQNAAVVQATIPQTTADTTEEALFVDLTAGNQQAEVITDIKKEGIIVDDVKKEHIAPDMNQFLTPEQGMAPSQATPEEVQQPAPVVQEVAPATPQSVVQDVPQAQPVPQPVAQEPVVPRAPEVNPYTHETEYENKFAGMFANQETGGDTTVPEPTVETGQFQERPVLTPPPQRKPVKRKGISSGTLMLILLFVGGMIFVLFLPQISAFFGGF